MTNRSISSHLRSMALAMVSAVVFLQFTAVASAQEPLSLADAIKRAAEHNPNMRAAQAGLGLSSASYDMARARLLPQVDVSESFARTDHPVLAFGARLAQKRLEPANLSPDALNSPAAINDWVTRLEGRLAVINVAAWYGLSAAESGEAVAKAERRQAEAGVVAQTVAAYYGAQLAEAGSKVAAQMLQSAQLDLQRIEAAQAAGTAMAADVAGLRAEVASYREQVIKAEGAVIVAQAELARAMGAAVNTKFTLTTPLMSELVTTVDAVDELAGTHPSLVQSEAQLAAAEDQRAAALATFAPTLGVMGAVEHHAHRFAGSGGSNYLIGVELRMNLLAGGADAARFDQAEARVQQARAMREDVRAAVELEHLRARRAVQDAAAIVQVTAEAAAHARESHRLERARLESGMAQSADVVRARAALLRAENRHLEAVFGSRMAAVQLAAAGGHLDRNFQGRTP